MSQSVAFAGGINTGNTVNVNNINNIVIGWPPGWAAPPVLPAPFEPESLRLDPAAVAKAVAELPAGEAPGVASVVALVMQIIEGLHADPAERNLYPNPNRSDQTIAFAVGPERWDVSALSESQKRLVGQVIGVLRTAATAARREVPRPDEICSAAMPAFVAHMANLQTQAASGVSVESPRAARVCVRRPPHFFGEEEVHKYTDEDLFSVADALAVAGVPLCDEVGRALGAYDDIFRSKRDSNHTAIERDGDVWVWDNGVKHGSSRNPARWTKKPAAEAAHDYAIALIKEFSIVVDTVFNGTGADSCPASREVLTRVARAVASDRLHGVTPGGEAFASGPAARALFARRAARARLFYLGGGACHADCPCSCGTARRILEGVAE